MSDVEHKAQAPASVACFVLTVSDSRTPETDTGGGGASGGRLAPMLGTSGSRMETIKRSALDFVSKRPGDAIGLVVSPTTATSSRPPPSTTRA